MATMEELLADCGLGEATQTKTASAATGAPSSKEVDDVLESLGLKGTGEALDSVTKTASEERNHMGLTNIYEEMFGEKAPEQEKTASDAGAAAEGTGAAEETTETEETTGEASASNDLGELTGTYFSVMRDALHEKVAGDLEIEAGAGHKPQGGVKDGGELSRIVGKEGDPALPVNADASSGAALKVMTGNKTPYSLKAKAQIKAILKRQMGSAAGDVGGYHE